MGSNNKAWGRMLQFPLKSNKVNFRIGAEANFAFSPTRQNSKITFHSGLFRTNQTLPIYTS